MARQNPSIVVITESWLGTSDDDCSVALPGFTIFRGDRNEHGGGVAVYVSDQLQDSASCRQISICKTSIRSISLPHLLLCAIYHLYWGSSAVHKQVVRGLQSMCESAGDKDTFVLCGDINDLRFTIDEFYAINGLTQIINFSTRDGNCLYVFATDYKSINSVKVSKLPPLGLSDHSGFYVQGMTTSVTKIKVRSFNACSFARCREALSGTDWRDILVDDIDLAVENLDNVFSNLFFRYFPEKTVRMRNFDLNC